MSPSAGRAERILREAGLSARVEAAGHDGSVAAITLPIQEWDALLGNRALAARVKEAGFRYLALDLESPEGD